MSFRRKFRDVILRSYRKVAARPSWRCLNELLFDCSIRGLGILNYENDFVSGEHHLIHEVLPRLIQRDDPCFVDVGANIGNYSTELLKAFPQCSLLAIEPQPDVFETLKQNLSKWSNAKTLNLGVGSATSEMSLFNYEGSGHSEHASIYADVFKDLRPAQVKPIKIKIESLDLIVKQTGFTDRIDMLKIDTEGHEFEVLKGCTALLENQKISTIQLEFNDVNSIAGVFLRDIRKQLHDFRGYRLLPKGLLPLSDLPLRTELFAFQNLFFVRNDISL